MKYAILNGEKVEAVKGGTGYCQGCGAALIAKCGEEKAHHWSHKGKRDCDPWWENETEWHRSWKDRFPVAWQEVVHHDTSGEKHIADVKTNEEWILEFQHSLINPEERRARNAFYKKLVWVVDGDRRKTDRKQFQELLKGARNVEGAPILKVHFPEENRLLREWKNKDSLVFIDFHEGIEHDNGFLWFLFPEIKPGVGYISQFQRRVFIEKFNEQGFEKFYQEIILGFINWLSNPQIIRVPNRASRTRPRFPRHGGRRRF